MITVIAGVNGAGKSSILGEMLRAEGGDYSNPDEIARAIIAGDPSISQDAANAQAWEICFDMLNEAIERDDDYYFETTLGGASVFEALNRAMASGRQVRIIYVGLVSPELHIQRVNERVARGGHPIPEEKIRQRWDNSLWNMVNLIPHCYAVRVIDNSRPLKAGRPQPITLFTLVNDDFTRKPVKNMPIWAQPLAAVAIKKTLLE